MGAEAVFTELAAVLDEEQDLVFAATMVQVGLLCSHGAGGVRCAFTALAVMLSEAQGPVPATAQGGRRCTALAVMLSEAQGLVPAVVLCSCSITPCKLCSCCLQGRACTNMLHTAMLDAGSEPDAARSALLEHL